jgi:hypothetical protein
VRKSTKIVIKIFKIIFVLLDEKLKNEYEKKEYFFCVFAT